MCVCVCDCKSVYKFVCFWISELSTSEQNVHLAINSAYICVYVCVNLMAPFSLVSVSSIGSRSCYEPHVLQSLR